MITSGDPLGRLPLRVTPAHCLQYLTENALIEHYLFYLVFIFFSFFSLLFSIWPWPVLTMSRSDS